MFNAESIRLRFCRAGLQQQLQWPSQVRQLQQQHSGLNNSLEFSRSSSSSSYEAAYQQHRRHIPEMHGTTVLCVRKDNQVSKSCSAVVVWYARVRGIIFLTTHAVAR